MKVKIFFPLLLIAVLLVFSLSGCSKSKVTTNEEFPASDISELQISADTWNLSVIASNDKNVRISFDGSVADKNLEPTAAVQDGILMIIQKSTDEEQQEQIALGKKGQITLYLPSDCIIPVKVNNGMGDVEMDSVSFTDMQLVNSTGYATFSNVTADSMKASSSAGDITVKASNLTDTEIVTSSGYVKLNNVVFSRADITTKSGEVNASSIIPDTEISIQTGSGDINLSYHTSPSNLNFGIASGSKDITVQFSKATYITETTECKQGTIGNGEYELVVNSDSGTIVIK